MIHSQKKLLGRWPSGSGVWRCEDSSWRRRNKGKIEEIRELLGGVTGRVVGLEGYPGLRRWSRPGKPFQTMRLLKAKAIAEYTGELTLADDSGLEVDYLGGNRSLFGPLW